MQLMVLGLLFPAVAAASPCEVPLRVRSVTPELNQQSVPRDSRVLVSFIGQGSDAEFAVTLLESETPVETETNSWCYEHEGPYEKHCWFSLKPNELLRSNQRYTIQIRSTESFGGEEPIVFDSSFHTDSDTHPVLSSTAPNVALVELTDFEGAEIGECDYEAPRRILIEPSHSMPDEDRLGVYHIEELNEDGSAFPVHTVFATQPVQEREFVIKQYADLGANPTGCYRLWVEDGSGASSAKTDFCWTEFGEDTGQEDTGQEDTGLNDTQGGDTNATDTASEEPGPGEEGGDSAQSCGCSIAATSSSATWFGFAALLMHGIRRRETQSDPSVRPPGR